ncbi:MAG TPA: hypothetical protein VGR81_09990 [Candidatus Acidoferrales bacterium]|nr:hypothetical protein [Candidatus Acidoferrales bacterium]
MARIILAVIAGLIAWAVVVTVCDIAMRKLWIDYALVEKSLVFTLPMKIMRLLESGVSSVVSGFVVALVAKERIKTPLATGVVTVAMFLPTHISIWHKFPVWYHLTFFTSLLVLSVAGGLLRRPAKASSAAVRAEA